MADLPADGGAGAAPWTARTQEAFNSAAPVYDEAYEGLPGIRQMRAVTAHLYLRFFSPGSRLLEINCGTGNDAVFLAEHGIQVLATDLSPGMIGEVEKKVGRRGLGGMVAARCLSFDRLGTLQGMAFEGAYSNLGGLNCTDALGPVAEGLGGLVREGGIFIATVMPPFCLWETAAFLGRGRWSEAFRRRKPGGTAAHLHGGIVQTFYHSPRAFRRAFAPYFAHVMTVGLAVFLPPPNFAGAYALLGRGAELLGWVDRAAAGVPLLRSIGDHYCMVLRRTRER